MLPQVSGAARLFTLFGISVFIHWTWLILVVIAWQTYQIRYNSPIWAIAELVAIFAIVTMHEFGHALACRSVGGRAHQIVLWPLGGVAFVQPPRRPGAVLWSIAAGPLVNVALVPVTYVLLLVGVAGLNPGEYPDAGWTRELSDGQFFLVSIFVINLIMLVFNLLPAYPLDGGQILQSMLWFKIGYARSLWISSLIGVIAAVVGGFLAFTGALFWLLLICVFIGLNSWNAFRAATLMLRYEAEQQHPWDQR